MSGHTGRRYADYLPPRGLSWVWWQVRKAGWRLLSRAYFRVFPPREDPALIGGRVRSVAGPRTELDLPAGSEGVGGGLPAARR